MHQLLVFRRIISCLFFLCTLFLSKSLIAQNCNNWLLTNALDAKVQIGDVDITGDQITVEGMFNLDGNPAFGIPNGGKLVSKHTTTTDINYALLPNGCEITTTDNGYQLILVCYPQRNRWYHAAMTYDGKSMKYYRDGYLMKQVACTGNLINNDLSTTIAQIAGTDNSLQNQFGGHANEIRIWNVAKTQAEIQQYMSTTLPNPTTQPGLVAYYTFDNLNNKQGNPAFNAVLLNGATINQTNPNCTFSLDSCFVPVPDKIINNYTEVTGYDLCNNRLRVSNSTAFHVGDTVLLMQMKGATISTDNNPAFGDVTDYHSAGNYEFNYVKAVNGNDIDLLNRLTRNYDIPDGKVQLIRVPYYQNFSTVNKLTCLPWDGSKGGVLVFNVANTLTLYEDIDVSGRGFKGGAPNRNAIYHCDIDSFYLQNNNGINGNMKGEGIYNTQLLLSGRGKLANGGGGGNSTNSGGAGGGNGGKGGDGGKQYVGIVCNPNLANGGVGGLQLPYTNALNRVYLGGGGGAGHEDDSQLGGGGNGGGIVIITANTIISSTFSIKANGNDVEHIVGTNDDGRSGAGAGGSVLINYTTLTAPLNISVKGGKGDDCVATTNDGLHGPGGGGGGGIVWTSKIAPDANLLPDFTGGASGVNINQGGDPWGAGAGANGNLINGLVLPVDNVAFKPNIDSVRIHKVGQSCTNPSFEGLGYTNTSPIATWQWYFGDGGTSSSQNASHSYAAAGPYPVKLVVTDINGCKDSMTMMIQVCSEKIINDYTEVLSFDPCKNRMGVIDASAFHVGDTVLIIQMKGAEISTGNNASFGNITDYKSAGNYEFNYVKTITGNQIDFLNNITRTYDVPDGKVQLVRVPYYQNFVTTDRLSCLPWDGGKGGVLVFNVANSLTLGDDINVKGRGFKGGAANRNAIYHCDIDSFYLQNNNGINGNMKGEGIYNTPLLLSGRGKLANGGGGGNSTNSGGAGGGNGGKGGDGGKQYVGIVCNPNLANGGVGGAQLTYSNPLNKIFLGGGGGAGHEDDSQLGPGGNGGGIVIISANSINPASFSIKADGDDVVHIVGTNDDGRSGGGAGGTVLLNYTTLVTPLATSVKGGKGDDCVATANDGLHGPGGGGGGGVVWINKPAADPNLSTSLNGGLNGVNLNQSNNPWGAAPGDIGAVFNGLVIPVDNTAFKQNIDSVRIRKTDLSCGSFDFEGLGYVNTSPVVTWQWYFGDGGTASSQNTSYTYSTSGNYIVKLVITDANGCKDSITTNVTAVVLNFDFNYSIDACDPLTVQFAGIGNTITNPYWDFGDGTIITGVVNPLHTYTATGNYIVRYSVTDMGCTDTVFKTITLDIIRDNIVLTTDTTICDGSVKQLLTVPSLNFCWTPATYLDNPNLPQPVTSTPQDITYYFTAQVTGNNLVANGNFTQGNTEFTSEYNFAASNTTQEQYFVGANPKTWNVNMSPCPDHTTGTGNMLLVNGSPVPDVNVWKQTVTVTPNTNYAFSTWIQSLLALNPAQLRFSINGKMLGNTITGGIATCTWTQAYTTWNSGNNTTAVISIINTNTQAQGNGFALDDISFAPVFIKRDSVKITVEKPVVKTIADVQVCKGTSVTLTTTGAQTYVWTPAGSLSDPAIASPVATPEVITEYHVEGTTINGCVGKDTVTVTLYPSPVITKSRDTTICSNASVQLFINGGISYAWTPAATLDDATSSNPTATPADSTMYFVTITDVNNCKSQDSVKVLVRPDPVFSVNAGIQICLKDSVDLLATGGAIYLWSPATGLSNSGIANPRVSPDITTDYSVSITEPVCNKSTVLSTRVTVLSLPTVVATSSNDLDCSTDHSQLQAAGASGYVWTPGTTLSNPRISNPVARPLVSTEYIVAGTDGTGCTNYDTVLVDVKNINAGGYLMPNAFTPNGDGKNDCFGIGYWGIIQEVEFSVYNRWGERIFFTKDPRGCWDGTYKGVLQASDVFVYMIKAKTACDPSVFRKGTVVLIR